MDHPTELEMTDVLARLADDPAPPPFALLRREGGPVELLLGEPGDVLDVDRLTDLPLPGPGEPPVLAFVPYRQVRELGFAHHDDGAPLRCLRARRYGTAPLAAVLAALPDDDVPLAGACFDVDDDAYAGTVKLVIEEEIGRGEGADFVIRRDLHARQPLPPARAALAVAGRLLRGEPGAYWVFAAHLPGAGDGAAGDLTIVGATPERHVSARAGEVVMNPISGTFRYPPAGPTTDGLLAFLSDTKEVEELFMVVDEELKMMSRLCDRGGRVLGPYLKPMGHLAHTEYLLTGLSDADPRDVLRHTMFAATVTGSPLENACRVIARHEPTGRGYYSGMAALIAAGPDGTTDLDAPILIRTAYLGAGGEVRIPVGATLVRHSVPEHEVAETHAKVAGLLSAFRAGSRDALPHSRPRFEDDPRVPVALAARNARLAPFWLQEQAGRPDPRLVGLTALVVDAEDNWTSMLAHVLRRLGMTAQVAGWSQVSRPDLQRADLLVAGPGPGDPRDTRDPRIVALGSLIAERRAGRAPLLAVCLSHQILAGSLGLPVGPLPRPHQGTQRQVHAFGRDVRVGFYNTYTARCRRPDLLAEQGIQAFTAGGQAVVEVAAQVPGEVLAQVAGEVVALRGPGFASVQFHPESILSPDGVDLLRDLAVELLDQGQRR
jgi:phenazine biosynthesis protein phzE